MTRQPCRTCPWRLDQHAQDIPGFKLELAEQLVNTTSDQLGAPMFACHQSNEGEEVVCAGWLSRYGWNSIGVRLAMMNGRIKPEQLQPDDDWPELHDTFEDVIEKLREDCGE